MQNTYTFNKTNTNIPKDVYRVVKKLLYAPWDWGSKFSLKKEEWQGKGQEGQLKYSQKLQHLQHWGKSEIKESPIHFFYFYGLQTFQRVQIVHLVLYSVMDKTIPQHFQQYSSLWDEVQKADTQTRKQQF